MTVGELIKALSELDPNLPVCVEVCDSDFNVEGGAFADLDEVTTDLVDPSDSTPLIQLTGWAPITPPSA